MAIDQLVGKLGDALSDLEEVCGAQLAEAQQSLPAGERVAEVKVAPARSCIEDETALDQVREAPPPLRGCSGEGVQDVLGKVELQDSAPVGSWIPPPRPVRKPSKAQSIKTILCMIKISLLAPKSKKRINQKTALNLVKQLFIKPHPFAYA